MSARRRLPREWLVSGLSVLAVLAVWQLYAPSVSPILLKPPTKVISAFGELVANGELAAAIQISLRNLALGFAIAVAVGVAIGVLSARSWFVASATSPWVSALYATPLVALVPVIVLWVGFGPTAKVIVVFMFAVFAVLFSTARGVREVDSQLIEVARSYLATEVGLWRDVVLPSALPYIVTGVRLAVGRALIGVIIAEFYTSIAGLGYLIVTYANTFQLAKVFVPVVILMALGVGLTAALALLERRLAPWKRKEEQGT